MGRLFWKVFFGFWLTMLAVAALASLAVFVAYAGGDEKPGIDFKDNRGHHRGLASGRMASDLIRQSALVLQHGGKEALRQHWRGAGGSPPQDLIKVVLAIDQDNRELLGRPVPRKALRLARKRLTGKTLARKRQKGQTRARGVQQVVLSDGQHFVLFIPRQNFRRHPPRRRPLIDIWLAPGIAGIGLIFSLLFSGALAWYFSRPIKALKEGFARVAAGDLATRVAPQIGARKDELADLGAQFDRATERLNQLVVAQRTLLHDVSHELRSPLARIQAAIGLMAVAPEQIDDLAKRVEQETERLDELIGEILALSRLESAEHQQTAEAFDIDAVLDEIVKNASFEGASNRKITQINGLIGTKIFGHKDMLHRAIENIVRNALKYTIADSAVTVDVSVSGANKPLKQVKIAISDHGPGIDPRDFERARKAFVRQVAIDPAHPETQGFSTALRNSGFGLGLAMAERAMQIHGGSLSMANRPTGGLVVTLEFPLNNGSLTSTV